MFKAVYAAWRAELCPNAGSVRRRRKFCRYCRCYLLLRPPSWPSRFARLQFGKPPHPGLFRVCKCRTARAFFSRARSDLCEPTWIRWLGLFRIQIAKGDALRLFFTSTSFLGRSEHGTLGEKRRNAPLHRRAPANRPRLLRPPRTALPSPLKLVAMKNSRGTERKRLVREARNAWRASVAASAGGVPARGRG